MQVKPAAIIGLKGAARSGKDTAAKTLIAHGWIRKGFADALKRDMTATIRRAIISANHNPPSELEAPWFDDPALKEKFRPLMVEYGRAMRALRPLYWVERLALELEPDLCYVIADVRYPNEAEWIHALGGQVVELERPGYLPVNEEESASLAAFTGDYRITNDGTVAELQQKLVAFVEKAFGGTK